MYSAICVLTIFVCVTCSDSTYIGLPERSWKDASAACNLTSKQEIESKMLNLTSAFIHRVPKVWIGTRVKYSHWSAFMGCGNGFTSDTPTNISTKATLKECLINCSEDPLISHIAVQNSECRCLSGKAETIKETDCRKKCDNKNESLCASSHSAMLFKFFTDFIVKPAELFIGDECVVVNPKNSTKSAAQCDRKLRFPCKNNSIDLTPSTWDRYQEKCLEGGKHVLYDVWYTGGNLVDEALWTAIFRVHKTYSVDLPSAKDICLSLLLNEEFIATKNFSVEDCAKQHPFLCVKSENSHVDHDGKSRFAREITLSIYIVIAAGILFMLLILVIIGMSLKLSQSV